MKHSEANLSILPILQDTYFRLEIPKFSIEPGFTTRFHLALPRTQLSNFANRYLA